MSRSHGPVSGRARAALGEDEFAGAWASGQLLSPEQAVVAADAAGRGRSALSELTARELEVLKLVAEGLSDAEVSERRDALRVGVV